jgi:hypothetical protein
MRVERQVPYRLDALAPFRVVAIARLVQRVWLKVELSAS